MTNMPLESKKTSLLLLVITAFVCSRALFFFFHDPEGPNLLIVTVLALILYSASFIAWRFIPATTGEGKKLLFAISRAVTGHIVFPRPSHGISRPICRIDSLPNA